MLDYLRAKFVFASKNHIIKSLSAYPFRIFYEEWSLDKNCLKTAWDNKGDIIVGNDVWIRYEAIIMLGVYIGDGSIIGTRAVSTKAVPLYTIIEVFLRKKSNCDLKTMKAQKIK